MKVFGISDIGKVREVNQDSYFICEREDEIFAVVCDGIGGGNAGDVASKLVCEIIESAFNNHKKFSDLYELKEWLNLIITNANEALVDCSNKIKKYKGMGTTLVGYFQSDIGKIVLNIGDSRVYTKVDNDLVQITNDHTLVYYMYQKGILDEQQYRNHVQKNIINNALGAGINFKIDYHEVQLVDNLMLLCSDGLTDMLSNEEILEVLLEKLSLEEMANKLIVLAKEAGGYDNITVVLVEDKKND